MTIELTDDEALVLFELLSREDANLRERQLTLVHASERNALWAVTCELERKLVAPLQKEYPDLLGAARARVEEAGGSW
jgi:hypothetical protein